MKGVEKTT